MIENPNSRASATAVIKAGHALSDVSGICRVVSGIIWRKKHRKALATYFSTGSADGPIRGDLAPKCPGRRQ